MQANIYEENEAKIYAAINRIREEKGIQVSRDRLINTLISIVDSVEAVETLSAVLKVNPEAAKTIGKKKVTMKRTQSWATRI